MRTEITKDELQAALSDVLSEMCEVFIRQKIKLDALTNEEFCVATLYEWATQGVIYNESSFFQRIDDRYVSDIMLKAGSMTARYFRYDTVEDLKVHIAELMVTHLHI